ncbi:hypothetical protein HUT19_36255 [Streptomyces sp. NA02950]|nr:hypothetical protein HUT19_36255 [Streptomyces sp. NA02950]
MALDGFDETKYGTKGKDGDIALNRFAAAGALAVSAAAGDRRYKPLAEALRRSQFGYAQELAFKGEVKKELTKARRLCEDL